MSADIRAQQPQHQQCDWYAMGVFWPPCGCGAMLSLVLLRVVGGHRNRGTHGRVDGPVMVSWSRRGEFRADAWDPLSVVFSLMADWFDATCKGIHGTGYGSETSGGCTG